MHGAMKTQGRPCFYSSFIPRSLRTQVKQTTSSRDNLDVHVESVTQGRHAAILVFASKHTLREGNRHHSYLLYYTQPSVTRRTLNRKNATFNQGL